MSLFHYVPSYGFAIMLMVHSSESSRAGLCLAHPLAPSTRPSPGRTHGKALLIDPLYGWNLEDEETGRAAPAV